MTQPATSCATRFLRIERENIPELLRAQSRWLCWKAAKIKPNGKFDKIPCDPSSGRAINGCNPLSWRTFEEAMNAYIGGYSDGIGFALSENHPLCIDGGDFYVTVADFDNCLDQMSDLQRLWKKLGEPLVELSPSGNGLHMWGLTRVALKGGNAGEGRELYSGGRFVTMTGIKAKGTFGECPGFVALEHQWFPPNAKLAKTPPLPPIVKNADLPSNIIFGQTGDHWFDRLREDDKSACLAELLRVPAVKALADTPDNAPSPNWRTVVAACVRSGAPDAYSLCRAWAATSPRFDPNDFDLRWRSYSRG